MKKIILIAVVAISVQAIAQKTKTIEVWKKPGESLSAIHTLDNDNNNAITQTYIYFSAQDGRYSNITEYITLFYGSPKDFIKYVDEVEKFYNENEPQTSSEVGEHAVTLMNLKGKKVLLIMEDNKGGGGFKRVDIKDFLKMRDQFKLWADKNSISYTP